MTNPDVMPQDAERLVVDRLTILIAGDTATPTVGIALPNGWTKAAAPHLQVEAFTAFANWPVQTRPTIRVVAWAASTTEAKRLAAKAGGLLTAYEGELGPVRWLTGPDAARDDKTQAEIASVELTAAIRSIPIS